MTAKFNMFFYSRSLDPKNTSKELFEIMQREGVLSHFKLVCIEDYPRGQAPVKLVPTIIEQGRSNLLVGTDAFKYIANMTAMKKVQTIQQNMIQNRSYKDQSNQFWQLKNKMMQSQTDRKSKFKTIDYSGKEMSASTDSYAFVDENNNNAFPQHFVGINKNQYGQTIYDADKICTAPESKDANALKKKDTDERTTKLKESRKEQDKIMKDQADQLNRKRVELAKAGLLPDMNTNIKSALKKQMDRFSKT